MTEAKLYNSDRHCLGIQLTGSYYLDNESLFKDLTFDVSAGEWTCLLGSSGIGKSTLLRLIAGLSTSGRFEGNIFVTGANNKDIDLNSHISYMAQADLLYPWLDVHQNVLLGQRLRKEPIDLERANSLIQQVGLQKHAQKRPHQLSGGMRQRAALARTLMEDKPVVLLDEPFSALDVRTRSEMQALAFATLQGKTVLLVSHDPTEAVRLSHQLYVMNDQGIQSFDTPDGEAPRTEHDQATLKAQAKLITVLRS